MDFLENEKLKSIVTNPIINSVLLVLAIGSLVTFGVINSELSSKAEQVSNLGITSITRDEQGNIQVEMLDYEASVDETYITTQQKLVEAANPEAVHTDKITKYFETRYNYDNGEANNVDATLDVIQEFSTDSFVDTVEKEMKESKKDGESTASVERVFIIGANIDEINAYSETIQYVIEVDINGNNNLYKVSLASDSGEWKINAVSLITSD